MHQASQKVPIILAIFAWLMQLSVFITPIVQKHPEIGNGICEELAVISMQSSSKHHMKHDMQNMIHNSQMQMDMHSSLQQDDIHSPMKHTDTHCKFCLIFGHNFDPILLLCLLIFLSLLLKIVLQRVLQSYFFKLHQKIYNYFFRNRAPPLSLMFTP